MDITNPVCLLLEIKTGVNTSGYKYLQEQIFTELEHKLQIISVNYFTLTQIVNLIVTIFGKTH